jgi:hypothetical protein
MCTLASPYNCWLEHKHHVSFIIIYATILFFSNFGPNSTTFIPIEIYLTRFRSTLHGFCVACNKIDAIVVGAFIFNYIAQSKTTPSLAGPNPKYLPGIGLRNTLFILLSLGLVLTFFIPEIHQKPLKDLTRENDEHSLVPIEIQHKIEPFNETLHKSFLFSKGFFTLAENPAFDLTLLFEFLV